MTGIELHELDDESDTLYVVAVPESMGPNAAEDVADLFEHGLRRAGALTIQADVDSDLAIGELSEEELERIVEEHEGGGG